jgi:hypothetical protein
VCLLVFGQQRGHFVDWDAGGGPKALGADSPFAMFFEFVCQLEGVRAERRHQIQGSTDGRLKDLVRDRWCLVLAR